MLLIFQQKKAHCHAYSYPYKLKYVCKVSLFDEHPFEHEFFLRIAESFPLMEKLTVVNDMKTCLPFDVRVFMDYELVK